MLVELEIMFVGAGFGRAWKVIQTDISPTVGMIIEDTAWDSGRPIVGLRISTSEPERVYADLGKLSVDSPGFLVQLMENYQIHKWETKAVVNGQRKVASPSPRRKVRRQVKLRA